MDAGPSQTRSWGVVPASGRCASFAAFGGSRPEAGVPSQGTYLGRTRFPLPPKAAKKERRRPEAGDRLRETGFAGRDAPLARFARERRAERRIPSPATRRSECDGVERETGFEPATNSLEGCDSTPELLPLNPPRQGSGGGGWIRTIVGLCPTDLQSVAFDRSATPPATSPMEPAPGFEPRTYCLQGSCSTN